MPNVDRPSGLTPVRHKDGTPYANQHNLYLLISSNATAVFVGDAVSHAGGAGTAGLRVDGIDVEGMPTVQQTVAGDSNIVGVVVGFYPRPDALTTKHRPASTRMIAMVADDQNLIFEVQEDSEVLGSCTLSAAEVGRNYDLIVGTGDADTGLSAMELDSSTGVTTTANLRLLRLVPRANNIIGTNARWEVLILEHFDRTPTGV